jgi:hypothetical protein
LVLVIWQAGAPDGEIAAELRGFVERGGVLLCLPSGEAGAAALSELSWETAEDAPKDEFFPVSVWDRADGPLADTEAGRSLPLGRLAVIRRQVPVMATGDVGGVGHAYAAFADGRPFLLGAKVGTGWVFGCAVLPQEDWSSLGDGTILVPLVQRLLHLGADGLFPRPLGVCGEWAPASDEEAWVPVETGKGLDWRCHAGVYQCGNRRIALNLPEGERAPTAISADDAEELLEPLSVSVMAGALDRTAEGFQSELAPFLVVLVMLFMVGEAVLASGALLGRIVGAGEAVGEGR